MGKRKKGKCGLLCWLRLNTLGTGKVIVSENQILLSKYRKWPKEIVMSELIEPVIFESLIKLNERRKIIILSFWVYIFLEKCMIIPERGIPKEC